MPAKKTVLPDLCPALPCLAGGGGGEALLAVGRSCQHPKADSVVQKWIET
jgi:hypothetical protein